MSKRSLENKKHLENATKEIINSILYNVKLLCTDRTSIVIRIKAASNRISGNYAESDSRNRNIS